MKHSPVLLTVRDVADALSCSQRTVYSLIYSGQLASCKVGALRRVSAVALDAYIESVTSAKTPSVAGEE